MATGSYLHDLRNNRPARPAGARPPPPSAFLAKRYSTSNLSSTPAATSVADRVQLVEDVPARCASAQSFRPKAQNVGRPLARPPTTEVPLEDDELAKGEDHLPYLERGQRWLERQEAHSLRRALEDMDIQKSADGVDKKVFDDAQDEAAALVWKHQNPNHALKNPAAPYRNPDVSAPGYKDHLRKSSVQARTLSWSKTAQDIQKRQMKRRSRDSSTSRSVSGGSKSSSVQSSRVPSDGSLKVPGSPVTPVEENVGQDHEPRRRAVQFKEPTNDDVILPEQHKNKLRQMIRNRTPSPSKAMQALGLRSKPEELGAKLEEKVSEMMMDVSQSDERARVANISSAANMAISAVPSHFRNPFSRARDSRGKLSRVNTEPVLATKSLERVEIQRNPPSQSRNPIYTMNNSSGESRHSIPEETVPMKDGKEIRSEDIRKATSASLKDRSAKLPTPTMVSDSPGRPIVSFQQDWQPKAVELEQKISPVRALPKPIERGSAMPIQSIEKPLPVSQKQDFQSTGSSMQLPSREREKVSPPPALLVHTASEPIVPTINNPDIPTISVSCGPPPARKPVGSASGPVPFVAVNDRSRHVSAISVHDDLPTSLKIGASGRRPAPRAPNEHVRPLPHHARTNDSRPLPTLAVNNNRHVSAILAPETPVPSIAVSAPLIAVSGPPTHGSSTRPLPTPGKGRPSPHHAASAPPGSAALHKSHMTLTGYHARHTGAQCSTCALSIAGRIVTAAGVRFHPECFRCHHCGEGLECVAFYPEPESHRIDRVNRIRDRMAGYEDVPGSEEEDGDEGLRFYCHLDYHEFFSPRCKSCKTPIEGEVVVACGAEWHVGHFFCAQCGDPFDDKTPFVEKDGYAWCVNCHTHRYSTKCKKCRKPVTDTVVRALDAEWHEQCFCCTECNGRFEDGRYFIRPGGTDPFCSSCEERRLKA